MWAVSAHKPNATLDAMFAGAEPHAATDLFLSVGAEPLLQILDVVTERESES